MAVAVLRAAGRADAVAVSYSEAAKRLRVSVPTVDSWVQRGVLERVDDATVRSVNWNR
jgi:transposase